jgi:AcrR family transcriptional regulator
MPTPRRRLGTEIRREEIIAAAERLLRKGGAAVRVEDVVAEAGAAKGTFYTAFDNWDDLLEEIRTRKAAELENIVAPLLPDGPDSDWVGALSATATAFVDFVLALEGLHEVLFHSLFTRARPMPAERRPAARIAALLKAGQAAGRYGALDAEPAAALIFAMMHEAADAIAAGADRGRCLAALDRMLRRIVAP